MSENKRSFWASIPGLVTGLAGLLTGIVGLITLLVQLDVIGGDKAEKVATTDTPTTVAGSPTTVAGVTTTAPSSFTVPSKLTFAPTDPTKEKTVTVRNTSPTTDLRLTAPTVTGTDKSQFVPTLGDCPSTLRPNAVCNLKVTFTPSGPLKNYSATVQVNAVGAPTQQVEITASTIL